jgi:hypothetical protein
MIKLDLHMMRYKDARRAVYELANTYWKWDPEDEAEIITGHSPNMRNMVIEILEEYSIEYNVGGPLGISNSYIKIN